MTTNRLARDEGKPRLSGFFRRGLWSAPGLVFFLLVLSTATITAQDSPGADEPGAGPAEQAEEKPPAPESEDNAPETFRPTEEVSEDYSIEFPTDI